MEGGGNVPATIIRQRIKRSATPRITLNFSVTSDEGTREEDV